MLPYQLNRIADHFQCAGLIAASLVIKANCDLNQAHPDEFALCWWCAFPIFFQNFMAFKIITLRMEQNKIV
ncbi:Uncharacterised protein [Mycobacterium tuberculosis]|nr:Uncharacterised protein [Mycobacterium tuberculosis]